MVPRVSARTVFPHPRSMFSPVEVRVNRRLRPQPWRGVLGLRRFGAARNFDSTTIA